MTNELAVFREGRASKEIRMLKGVVQSMEEDLLKEKNRHQRSSAKSQQELRRLNDEVERLRNAESDLKVGRFCRWLKSSNIDVHFFQEINGTYVQVSLLEWFDYSIFIFPF